MLTYLDVFLERLGGGNPHSRWEGLPYASEHSVPLSVLEEEAAWKGSHPRMSFPCGLSCFQFSLLFNFNIWSSLSGCAPLPGAQIAFVKSQGINSLLQQPVIRGQKGQATSRRWRGLLPLPSPHTSLGKRQLCMSKLTVHLRPRVIFVSQSLFLCIFGSETTQLLSTSPV